VGIAEHEPPPTRGPSAVDVVSTELSEEPELSSKDEPAAKELPVAEPLSAEYPPKGGTQESAAVPVQSDAEPASQSAKAVPASQAESAAVSETEGTEGPGATEPMKYESARGPPATAAEELGEGSGVVGVRGEGALSCEEGGEGAGLGTGGVTGSAWGVGGTGRMARVSSGGETFETARSRFQTTELTASTPAPAQEGLPVEVLALGRGLQEQGRVAEGVSGHETSAPVDVFKDSPPEVHLVAPAFEDSPKGGPFFIFEAQRLWCWFCKNWARQCGVNIWTLFVEQARSGLLFFRCVPRE